MIVKPLTEHYLEFLSLKGGCRGSSESTRVKMPHCWKSHALAYYYPIYFLPVLSRSFQRALYVLKYFSTCNVIRLKGVISILSDSSGAYLPSARTIDLADVSNLLFSSHF